MGEPEWSVVLYREGEYSPVAEFISNLDDRTQERITWSLEQLRVRNVRAREPLVKHIEGKLWELREASRGNIYRVFYFFAVGRRIVLLHGFQKAPRKEVELAVTRMNRFIESEGKRR